MSRVIFLFILLIHGTIPVDAASIDDDMTSNLICPCECAMIISTCDCSTAVQVNEEIIHMKESGFSKDQIFAALKAEYGSGILAHPERASSTSLWVTGISLVVILAFIVFIMTRKPDPGIIPGTKKYEQRFEEEYQKFVSEMEET